jgi:hypothetical protein
MFPSTPRALAVELHPSTPTHRIATYNPMVTTPAGRWADVTWILHQCRMPTTEEPLAPARWLEVSSPDPNHPCYAHHRAWDEALAAGYTAALTAHDAETVEEPLSPEKIQQLRDAATVVPAGQLSEWVLDDLQDEPSGAHR